MFSEPPLSRQIIHHVTQCWRRHTQRGCGVRHVGLGADCEFFPELACQKAAPGGWNAVRVNRKRFGAGSNLIGPMEPHAKKSGFRCTAKTSTGTPWPICIYLLNLNRGRNIPWDLCELDYWASLLMITTEAWGQVSIESLRSSADSSYLELV